MSLKKKSWYKLWTNNKLHMLYILHTKFQISSKQKFTPSNDTKDQTKSKEINATLQIDICSRKEDDVMMMLMMTWYF